MQEKICNECGILKQLTDFHKCKSSPSGYQYKCKECRKEYDVTHKEQRNISYKIWYEKTREQLREKNARYYNDNKEGILEKQRIKYATNGEICREKAKEWYAKNGNSEKYKKKQLQGNLKRRYNITLEEKNNLIEIQEGKCAICNLPRPLVIDHVHKTKQVRGLLCRQCNVVLGLIGDDPEKSDRISLYLRKWENEEICDRRDGVYFLLL